MRSYGRVAFVLVLVLTAAFALASAQRNSASAATPSSGTLGPTGPPVTWDGFIAAGAASASEATCVEGVNCDTFVLNVSGLPGDWTGKIVDVRISWLNPANDFDLYIHKGTNAGPVVADSGSGAPDTDEEATFDPSADGTGVYSVHLVQFCVAGEA